MAQPIIKMMIKNKVVDPRSINVYDIDTKKLSEFCSENNTVASKNIFDSINRCNIVVLAIKPQLFSNVLSNIADSLKENDPVIISIAAGKTTEFISSFLDYNAKVARIFPNLNAEVGESISAYCGNKFVVKEQLSQIEAICKSFGQAVLLEEKLFPVFGVAAGCAPAYSFLFIDSLAKAARENGIPHDLANSIVTQVVLGSAKLLIDKSLAPTDVIKRVCSPGGTTIEGINSLNSDFFQDIIKKAFNASLEKDKLI